VNSRGFRDLLAERGVPLERIDVVLNWCDERSLTAECKSEADTAPAGSRFRILFAGNMGLAQALDAVLAAADQLRTKAPNIDFVFIGSGIETDRLRRRAKESGLSNVIFHPRVAMGEVGVFLRRADALLVHLKDDPLFSITIPGKTQAYMAIGKPILMAARGNAAELVRQAQCGVEATPENATSIADAAMKLASLSPCELAVMGQRGRTYYESNLALSVGVDRFATVFERVTREPPFGTLTVDSVSRAADVDI
jgi:colanic acid biosynthesis glycosyl transferase WcaI